MKNLKNMTDIELVSYVDTHMTTEPVEALNVCKTLLQRTISQQLRIVVVYTIACLYRDGIGIQDYKKAFFYMSEAAENGHCQAQLNLGTMYKEGMGIESNIEKAIFWFEKSANQGDVDAQYSLGVMYQSFAHNYTKALYWYEKAVKQNDPCAKYNLGHMYENGQGVKTDLHKAQSLYNQAALQGLEVAKKARLRLIQRGVV